MSRQTGFSIALALIALSTMAAGAAEAHSRGGYRGGHHGHHGSYHGQHNRRWQCFDKYPKPVCYRVPTSR